MAKYIDMENYCENICRCSKNNCDTDKCPIHAAPAADVVEVVRCKDCKYYVSSFRWCKHPIAGCNMTDRKEDDFCSYGEKE